jgi:hypothetical protein
MIPVVVGIWTVVVFQTAGGVRQRSPAFGDASQNRSPHIGGCSVPVPVPVPAFPKQAESRMSTKKHDYCTVIGEKAVQKKGRRLFTSSCYLTRHDMIILQQYLASTRCYMPADYYSNCLLSCHNIGPSGPLVQAEMHDF